MQDQHLSLQHLPYPTLQTNTTATATTTVTQGNMMTATTTATNITSSASGKSTPQVLHNQVYEAMIMSWGQDNHFYAALCQGALPGRNGR